MGPWKCAGEVPGCCWRGVWLPACMPVLQIWVLKTADSDRNHPCNPPMWARCAGQGAGKVPAWCWRGAWLPACLPVLQIWVFKNSIALHVAVEGEVRRPPPEGGRRPSGRGLGQERRHAERLEAERAVECRDQIGKLAAPAADPQPPPPTATSGPRCSTGPTRSAGSTPWRRAPRRGKAAGEHLSLQPADRRRQGPPWA